jgi:ribosomal protein S27E
MASYSLSVFCPRCGRTEDGLLGTETETINCAACGHVIASWEEAEGDYVPPEDADDPQ